MRRNVCLLAAVLVLPSLGSDLPKEHNDRVEYVGIDGTWEVVEVTLGGTVLDVSKCVHDYHCGIFTSNLENGDTFGRGNYRVNLIPKPPHLDFVPAFGRTIQGIYRIDGDILKIAWPGLNDDRRPKGFDDKGVLVVTFKRMRK